MLLSFYLTLTMKDIKKDLKNSGSNEIQVYSLLYSIIAIFFFFFWILGYYATRLTFTIVPPIVMFNTIAFNRTIKYLAPFYKYLFLTLIFIVTLIWCYYHITNYGPFSWFGKPKIEHSTVCFTDTPIHLTSLPCFCFASDGIGVFLKMY